MFHHLSHELFIGDFFWKLILVKEIMEIPWLGVNLKLSIHLEAWFLVRRNCGIFASFSAVN